MSREFRLGLIALFIVLGSIDIYIIVSNIIYIREGLMRHEDISSEIKSLISAPLLDLTVWAVLYISIKNKRNRKK